MNRHLSSSLLVFSLVFWSLPWGLVSAGPYTEAGIPSNDTRIVAWATGWSNLSRGPGASAGSPNNVLGPVTCTVGDTVSLGDGGELTLTFDEPISNGLGDDLVVFENGFFSGLGLFAELGFVEVSTDGVTFARFPSISRTPSPVDTYETMDPTDVYYLAGKHPGANQQPCEGTGFDLYSLRNHQAVVSGAVDLGEINYVKVKDVVGDGSTRDSRGIPIYDPYPTAFANGGFDLQAVGVIHQGSSGNPGPCAGTAVAEAAGIDADHHRASGRVSPFLLLLVPSFTIGVWRFRMTKRRRG